MNRVELFLLYSLAVTNHELSLMIHNYTYGTFSCYEIKKLWPINGKKV